MNWLFDFVSNPNRISTVCAIYIVAYYFISIFSISAVKSTGNKSWWRKNGLLDNLTSITSILVGSILIWSLGTLAFSATLTLENLIVYYFLFIFLFAFWYGILDWHWPGMLVDVSRDSWTALIEHVLISVQTQTTIGYTNGRPKRLLVEVIACVQALLGIFLITISIARAVNSLSNQ